MKKISKTLVSAILALSVSGITTSCSSENNDELNTIQTEAETLNDQQALALADNALFEYYHKAFGLSFIVETFTSKTHSFEGPESADGPLISRHELTPTNVYFVNRWYNKNSAVSNANDAIEKITAATGVSEQTKKEAIARAKLARALGYHVLVRLWGEVPLYTSTNGDTKTRASIDAIYTQIVKDLEEAAEGLPASASLPSVPTKVAAYGLLSRVYLDWGSNPLTYDQINAIKDQTTDPAPSYTPARLEKAVEYANKVIASGLLKLDPDYTKLYGRDYESNKRGTNEHLFTIAHDGDKNDAQGNHQTHCSWTFPFQNGENGNGYTQNHTEVADDDLYDDWKKEQPNDKRLAETYFVELKNPETGLTHHYYSPVYTPINGKGVDQSYDDAENLEIKQNSVDRIEVRYAEVLLTKAEALVQLGRNSEAADPFNQLRRRAGIAEVSTPTFDQIKREWDYEFTYEQFSVLNSYRWKDLISSVKQVKNYKHFADDWKDKQTFTSDQEAYFQKVHNHLVAKYNNIRGKHYRQPIPTGLQGEDLGIKQNPGY